MYDDYNDEAEITNLKENSNRDFSNNNNNFSRLNDHDNNVNNFSKLNANRNNSNISRLNNNENIKNDLSTINADDENVISKLNNIKKSNKKNENSNKNNKKNTIESITRNDNYFSNLNNDNDVSNSNNKNLVSSIVLLVALVGVIIGAIVLNNSIKNKNITPADSSSSDKNNQENEENIKKSVSIVDTNSNPKTHMDILNIMDQKNFLNLLNIKIDYELIIDNFYINNTKGN